MREEGSDGVDFFVKSNNPNLTGGEIGKQMIKSLMNYPPKKKVISVREIDFNKVMRPQSALALSSERERESAQRTVQDSFNRPTPCFAEREAV